MFGLSPYLLVGAAALLISTNIATGIKAYQFGGNAQKVACERRVDDLQAKWDKEIAKNNAINKSWTEAIVAVQENGNKEAADLQAENAALNSKVKDYEATLTANPSCVLSQPDIDKLQ